MSLACEIEVEEPRPLLDLKRMGVGVPAFVAYGTAIVLSILLTIVVLRLWRADLTVPMGYAGDALFIQSWIKSIDEYGWYLHNPNLGAPGAMDMHDFPMAESVHFLVIKFLLLVTPNYAAAFNLFYLLTFPLTAVTTLYVFRKFGIGYSVSVVASVLFAFVPYHLFRGLSHLFLASYYIVPLSIMVVLWVYLDRVGIFARRSGAEQQVIGPDGEPLNGAKSNRARLLGSLAICAVQSSAGVYYAFFSCFLLLVSGVAAAFERRKLSPLATALLFVAVTTAGVLANIAPSLIYNQKYGSNPEVGKRISIEAEMYGLKIAQLVLPIPRHRIGRLAGLREEYEGFSISSTENALAALGTGASIGFLILLGRLFYRRRTSGAPDLLDGLCTLNIFALLLATMGGFGAIFNLLVTPQIRAYNRISVFIAFFSLLALGVLFERLGRRLSGSRWGKQQFAAVLGVLLAGGIVDQVPRGCAFDYTGAANRWKNDTEFVARIEQALPGQAMVFQYPYMSFPEHAPIHEMGDYEHFRGYLHSNRLRWSYGALRGRQSDAWMSDISMKPVEEQLKSMAFAGFSGIYVDRRGYADKGVEIEATLARCLGSQPMFSGDEKSSFFSMQDYARRLKESLSPQEWESHEEANRYPLYVTWNKGFYPAAGDATNNFRWCDSRGEMMIHNPSPKEKQVTLQFTCASGYPEFANCHIESPLFSTELEFNLQGKKFSTILTVPPGHHKVLLSTNARKVDWAPTDPRRLVFQVQNTRIEEILRR